METQTSTQTSTLETIAQEQFDNSPVLESVPLYSLFEYDYFEDEYDLAIAIAIQLKRTEYLIERAKEHYNKENFNDEDNVIYNTIDETYPDSPYKTEILKFISEKLGLTSESN